MKNNFLTKAQLFSIDAILSAKTGRENIRDAQLFIKLNLNNSLRARALVSAFIRKNRSSFDFVFIADSANDIGILLCVSGSISGTIAGESLVIS